MSWSISTRNITPVRSFDEAKKIWDKAMPWRAEDPSIRQLGERRATHKHIAKVNDGDCYECVLHRTALVSYHANGNVTLRCHDSISSHAFTWKVSPPKCDTITKKGRMFWRVKTDDGDMYYRAGSGHLRLAPTPAGNWRLTSIPDPQHEWAHCRKLGAATRKLLKPYTLWYRTSQKLGMKLPSSRSGYSNRHSISELLKYPDGTENFLRLAGEIGPPERVRPVAYETTGANYKTPAPFDRLPRSHA